jgi:FkbM family methyltransferase
MLRHLLELLSRRIVLKRRLPRDFGASPVYVSPGSALNHWRFDLSKIDPMLFRLASELVRPGDAVWDIGANVGLFSFAAAAIAGERGRAVAVEADTWLVGLLRRSAALHGDDGIRVDVLPAAVSDRLGVSRFNIARRGRAASFLAEASGSTQTGGVREVQLVPTVTLDWLLDQVPAPRFVKIDVEGAELAVLRGARRLLSTARPVVLCEIFGETRREVDALLGEHGYELHDADLPRESRTPLTVSANNTLAYPTR